MATRRLSKEDEAAALRAKRRRALSNEVGARMRFARNGTLPSRGAAVVRFYEVATMSASAPCEYCGRDAGPGNRQVDHRIPFARGGTHSAANLAIACARCNLVKGKLTAEEYEDILNQSEAGEALGVHASTLATLSKRKDGPPRSRLFPRLIRYSRAELLDWMREKEAA